MKTLILAMALAGMTGATDSIGIEEVVITGTRSNTDARHLSQTVTVVGRDDIEKSGRLSLMPVLSMQVPGLFVTSRGVLGYGVSDGAAGNILMRGMSAGAGQILVLIDGHPQYAGIFGHPISDALQSPIAERIEVLRGPASILYGSNAMGGVVNIVTRKMEDDGSHTEIQAGTGSYGTIETQLSSSVRQGRMSTSFSGTYGKTDGHRENMDFEQFGGFVKLGYDLGRYWKAGADIDLTRFTASQPGPDYKPLEDADQRVTRGTASVFVENSYEKTTGAASIFCSWGNHWVNDGYADGTPKAYRFISDDRMSGISLWQSANVAQGGHVTIGLDCFDYGGVARNDSLDGGRKIIADRHENEFAAYVDIRQAVGNLLTVNAGLRADRHSKTGTELIPQAGLAFHLPAFMELKLSASKGFRHPTIKEMYMFAAQNPDLKPESLWNYELAFSQRAWDFTYGVNLFYIDARNLILTLPRTDGPGRLNVNSGSTVNRGFELMAAYRFSKCLEANANYSFLNMANPVAGAPEHKLFAGLDYDGGDLQGGFTLQYVNGLYSYANNQAGVYRTEDFLLCGLHVSYRLSNVLGIWANADNLLGTEYCINDGYPMPGRHFMAGMKFSF